MPLIPKHDVNQIFASQAPSIDQPPEFKSYTGGWGVESRPNNGKPTIKGFNKLQQVTDEKLLWIHQNGAALPFDENMEYAENAPVIKDGILVQKKGNEWKPVGANKASDILDESGLTQQEINNASIKIIDNSISLPTISIKDQNLVATKRYSSDHNAKIRYYRYEKDSIATPNNGTIFNCESGGRFILMGDSKTIDWSDWGFEDGSSYSGSDYFKPLVWGFENGYTIFKTSKNITLTSEFSYSFEPTEFKSINIDMGGLHKLNFNKVLTEAVTPILFYGNSNIDLNINVNIEGSGMGSYIDKPIYVRSLFISGFNKVDFYGKFKDIYGYGLFTDSPNIEIHKYEAIDCWGNNTIKSTLAFDAYGDGLYLSCLNAVVNNPVIINNKSISRAGIVVESLVQDKICNVVINNPKLYGYDRNIHIESMQDETILNVDINGGESNKSNTNLLIFSLNTAEINVNVNNISQETSVRPNPTIPHDFPSGHFMMSGENVSLKTNSCNFKKHISGTQLVGNSRAYSGINDTWGKDSKGLYPTWVKNVSLSNIDGSLCEDKISLGSGVGVFNANTVDWGGDIEIDYVDIKSQASNILFSRNSTGHCGRLILKPNVQGVQLSDFVFDNPIANWYAIDNQYTRLDVNDYDISNPMIENFVVYGGTLFKNGGAKYRRDRPSYAVLDENTTRVP